MFQSDFVTGFKKFYVKNYPKHPSLLFNSIMFIIQYEIAYELRFMDYGSKVFVTYNNESSKTQLNPFKLNNNTIF